MLIKKLINFQTLDIIKHKYKNKKIGMCHGVFDLLHLGHIKHFQEAKSLVDILIVSLTEDKFVKKGPGRPAFNQFQRSEALSALHYVDYIIFSPFSSAETMIKKIKPNFYFKGPDYKDFKQDITGKIKKEILSVKNVGGKVYFTSSEKFSSSSLINKFFGNFSERQNKIIKNILKKNSLIEIKKKIHQFKNIRPLVIGESIIDQYHYTETLGKSGKEPMLVIRDKKIEKYLGGAGAVCRHLANFVNKGSFLSYLGNSKLNNKFIRNHVPKIFNKYFLVRKNVPTILKRRFVDEISNSKIIGNYELDDRLLNNSEQQKLNTNFTKLLKKSDLVIVTDYGHGLINDNFAKKIGKLKKFTAVNVQINSSNSGYHSLKNYRNIDCIIINENEIRYEMRSKTEKLENLMSKLSSNLNIKNLIVTRGSTGSIIYIKKLNNFHYCDALAHKVLDKVGAGDAMLSLITLCLYSKIDYDLSLLIASLAASQSVASMGNKNPIDKNQLLKDLEHVL